MARRLDAALELLDRQLADSNGQLAGKVDDLELTDAGGSLEQPQVTAILTGPGALAGRFHSPFGRWLAGVGARLPASGHQEPLRVTFDQVEQIGSAIRVRGTANQLDTGAKGRAWHRPIDRTRERAMPLSELLGAEVVAEHGHTVGKVHDVRLEQTRPQRDGAVGPALRVEGLLVGRRALEVRFGFGRGGARGALAAQGGVRFPGHDGRYVAWGRIRSIRPRQIRITGTAGDLPRPQPLN
jgi:sporulation protein YlmC with PRC-barrel domain